MVLLLYVSAEYVYGVYTYSSILPEVSITRITFDFDIKESTNIEDFFNEDINYYDLTTKKDIVLEVKFDRFLEPYISNILSSYKATSQSVSKYLIGRNV